MEGICPALIAGCIGVFINTPPSTKAWEPTSTGGKKPGMAAEAMITRGPNWSVMSWLA